MRRVVADRIFCLFFNWHVRLYRYGCSLSHFTGLVTGRDILMVSVFPLMIVGTGEEADGKGIIFPAASFRIKFTVSPSAFSFDSLAMVISALCMASV